ncbi:hypothetical protein [Cellulomonas sp. KH9]|uniref:hypothetical protein n=1 Tax=Cellulomonas sp. KH9 TaxID=1855324 RepID=UPI0008E00E44|nr:hypothetical protein [Cellulomonas sp. KH9]SFJ70161.1 hypothetical protein SAMN05216467_0557 [Cellulomonas sp. KH9]
MRPGHRPTRGRTPRRPHGALAAALVLAVVTVTATGARADAPAITAMWVWDNSLDRAVDARGTGYTPADPATLAAFVREQRLTTVQVSVPWASDEGPVAAWVTEAVAAVRAEGATVGVLGGDPPWLEQPGLAVQWMRAATHGRTVDHVQLNVEPWTQPTWFTDRAGAVTRWLTLLDEVRAQLPPGVGLGVDVPYWLAWEPWGAGTVADAAMARADRVEVVAFVDHAHGPDGILALSADAVAAAVAAGVPFTVGVETDTPAVAGGAEWTFGDDGVDALLAETALVRDALAGTPGYEGVAVQHYRTWRTLQDAATTP